MINKLINLQFDVDDKTDLEINTSGFTIQQYATAFLSGLGVTQKERFKKMLENNFKCAKSVAENYGIDYDKFINEVKKQLGIKN